MLITEYKNFADDKKKTDEVKEMLSQLILTTRQNRQGMNQKFSEYLNIWQLVSDDRKGYYGRANLYQPAGRKAIETIVSVLMNNLFPTEDLILISPRNIGKVPNSSNSTVQAGLLDQAGMPNLSNSTKTDMNSDKVVEPLKNLLSYQLANKIRLRRQAKPFFRSVVTFGTGVAKTVWKHAYKNILTARKDDLFFAGKNVITIENKEIDTYNAPTFQPVNLLNWYIYPETVQDIEDAFLVFEDIYTDFWSIKAKETAGVYYDVDRIKNMTVQTESNVQRQLELSNLGITAPFDSKMLVCHLIECWHKYDINGDGKLEDCLTVLAVTDETASDAVVLRLQENPFVFKKPPYLAAKFMESTGQFYGHSLTEAIQYLQYELNDKTNQAMDCGTYILNPIAIVDPALIQDLDSFTVLPGAQWLGPPQAVDFVRMPVELMSVAGMAISQIYSLIQDFSGAPPILQGTAAPKTATGTFTLQGNSMALLKDISEDIESTVFERFIEIMYNLNWQFLNEELVPFGTEWRKVTKEDIVGNYLFQWLGTIHSQNQSVRVQQLINFLNLISRIPLPPNVQVDLVYILKKIWGEGLGFKDGDRVFKEIVSPNIPNLANPANPAAQIVNPANAANAANAANPSNAVGIPPQEMPQVTEEVDTMENIGNALKRARLYPSMGSRMERI